MANLAYVEPATERRASAPYWDDRHLWRDLFGYFSRVYVGSTDCRTALTGWARLRRDPGCATGGVIADLRRALSPLPSADYVQSHMRRNLAPWRKIGQDREMSVHARDSGVTFIASGEVCPHPGSASIAR